MGDKNEYNYEGLMLLVEAIILGVLDNILISGKWVNRDISLLTLVKKKRILFDMKKWFNDDKWDIWLSIYCEYKKYNKKQIKDNFEAIRKRSTKYVNKKIKHKISVG